MDWTPSEIQARFFRVGNQTFLWLDYNEDAALLSWSFTFLDLGMCHTLSGRATVSLLPHSPPVYSVNGQIHDTREEAMHAVFANHFNDFMTQIYADLDISNQSIGCHDTREEAMHAVFDNHFNDFPAMICLQEALHSYFKGDEEESDKNE